jgi:hypothetical protein
MRGIGISLALAGLSLLLSSCSKDDAAKGAAHAGGAAGTTAGTASGGSNAGTSGAGGSSSNGPAISSAPPAWIRPADCQGVGNLCPNLAGCEDGSTCQTEGSVCIPALEPGATSLPSKSMERPYCAAYTCMTFEQASCFCTGEAGKKDSRCESPEALAGLCQGEKRSCDAERKCCSGLSCVDRGAGSTCEQACAVDTDCESGCCTDRYDTGVKICAEKAACDNPCKKTGDSCMQGDGTTPSECCRGTCVESATPDYAGCRPTCTTGADCDTGCCIPFSNSERGFCVAALYCSCLAIDEHCGDSAVECCEGSLCAGATVADYRCTQLCTQPADCPSGCCRALADNSKSVCQPAENCPL